MIVRWKGTLTAISVLDSEAFERCLAYFTEDQSWNLREEVTYGSASGKKLIRTGEAIQGHFKDITYLLSVPGGHIDVTTGCAGKQLDKLALLERLLEDAFRTATVS